MVKTFHSECGTGIKNWPAPGNSCSISSRVFCFTYFCTYTQQATLLASDTMSAMVLRISLSLIHIYGFPLFATEFVMIEKSETFSAISSHVLYIIKRQLKAALVWRTGLSGAPDCPVHQGDQLRTCHLRVSGIASPL